MEELISRSKKAYYELLRDGWIPGEDYVFISYSSRDWEKAYPCVLALRALGINVYLAQVCVYMAGMLISYLVNRSWTFKTSSRFFSFQMVKFVISNLLTLAVSIGMLKLLIDFMGFGTIFAKLPTVCVTILLNFILSRFWVFK